MAEKNINGFIFDDTQDVFKTIEQFKNFNDKKNEAEKSAEIQKIIEEEKQKWAQEEAQKQAINSFLNSVSDEKNKKVVEKLINSGTSIDEIKTEFPNLIESRVQKQNYSNENVAVVENIVLGINQNGIDPQKRLIELSDKGINNLTENERYELISLRALTK